MEYNYYLAQVFSVGNALIDFFAYTDWGRVASVAKVLSFFVSASLFAGIAVVLKKHRNVVIAARAKQRQARDAALAGAKDAAAAASGSGALSAAEREDALRNWKRIAELWQSTALSDKRLAIIEADALLDDRLEHLRIPGDNLGERLKRVGADTLLNIEEVWFAHKLRNSLVHDLQYPFSAADDGERAFRAFAEALRALGIAG